MLVLGKFRMLGLRFRGFRVFMGLRHIGYVVLGFLLGILRAHTPTYGCRGISGALEVSRQV